MSSAGSCDERVPPTSEHVISSTSITLDFPSSQTNCCSTPSCHTATASIASPTSTVTAALPPKAISSRPPIGKSKALKFH